MDQSGLLQQMQLLREEYAAGLFRRFQYIEDIFQQLSVKHDDDLLQELFRQVHSLAGSAATFGYTRISTQAKSLEAIIKQCIMREDKLTEESRRQISSAMLNLNAFLGEGPDQAFAEQLPSIDSVTDSTQARTCRLYLVEDDEFLGAEIQAQLKYSGVSVQLFSDITRARDAINTQQPDAILLDILLLDDESDRSEMTALINDIHALSLPLLFISSSGDWKARLSAVRAGGAAFLTRPIDYAKLLSQLDRVAQRIGKEPYRVLIVDDTAELARHYALILRKSGMQVEVLTHPEKILSAIASFKPEFIVLDLYMPGVSGVEVANVVRQHQDLLGIPIVFLSTEQDRDIQLRALQNGDDFLQKPISDDHLIAAITSRAERARSLNALMYCDGLTGLLNHNTLTSRLETEIHRSRRVVSKLCFVMIDLDHFKTVNDTFGHAAGDRVLKGLSRLLTDRLRKTDQVGRYGGEEFAVILPDTGQASAFKIIDEIRQHFSALSYTADGTDFHCTFSAGIAQTSSDDTAGSLSKRAVDRLYSAKQNGRNRIVVAER